LVTLPNLSHTSLGFIFDRIEANGLKAVNPT